MLGLEEGVQLGVEARQRIGLQEPFHHHGAPLEKRLHDEVAGVRRRPSGDLCSHEASLGHSLGQAGVSSQAESR